MQCTNIVRIEPESTSCSVYKSDHISHAENACSKSSTSTCNIQTIDLYGRLFECSYICMQYAAAKKHHLPTLYPRKGRGGHQTNGSRYFKLKQKIARTVQNNINYVSLFQ